MEAYLEEKVGKIFFFFGVGGVGGKRVRVGRLVFKRFKPTGFQNLFLTTTPTFLEAAIVS